jgi:hypothetical protein
MAPAQLSLSLVAESFILPKAGLAQFAPRGLSIAPHASEADLLDIGHRVFAVRGQLKWMIGSLFAAMIEARDKQRAALPTHAQNTIDAGHSWVSSFADAHLLDPKERRELLGVYLFFRDFKDPPALSFDHYKEVMWGVDDGKPNAKERGASFLTHAQVHGLTVTELRRHIRASQATHQPEPKQLEMAHYSAVFEAMRFAKRELPLVQSYTLERCALILEDLGDTPAYVDALRARLAQQ